MSLRFDTSKIADRSIVSRPGSSNPDAMEDPTKEYWSHELTAVVHWSMIVNFGSVTEANYEKWYARYAMFMLTQGTPRSEWYITLEMLKRCIGLTCNVSDYTDAAYAKWIRSKIEETAKAIVSNARRELDAPKTEA